MRGVVFITVMCGFVSAPVLADLTVQYSGVSPSMSMVVESSSNSSISGRRLVAGQYNIDVQGDTGDTTGAPGAVNAFCIDLWDWVPTSPLSYTLEPLDMTPDQGAGPMGTVRAEYLATLLNTYWDQDNWSSDTSRTFDLGTGSAVYSGERVAAAVQLAVWEIVDEFNTDTTGWAGDTVVPTSWNVKYDLFRVSGDMVVQDIANAMLSSVHQMLHIIKIM